LDQRCKKLDKLNKMRKKQFAEPYAAALVDLGRSTNTLSFITKDITNIIKVFYENDELSEFLINPLYTKTAKKQVLDKVFEPLLLNQNTKNFINLLIQRSRIDMISLIAQKYSNIINGLENIKLANVKTASPLTSEQEKQIIDHLKLKTGAKDIELFTVIDKTLLGGLKVEISSMIIDVSLKGQLSQLATQLETTLF
jgi:F-type H+-transporting ATPase subunit delta